MVKKILKGEKPKKVIVRKHKNNEIIRLRKVDKDYIMGDEKSPEHITN